jgi:hypothetical protein
MMILDQRVNQIRMSTDQIHQPNAAQEYWVNYTIVERGVISAQPADAYK